MKYFISDLHFEHQNIINFCPKRVRLLGMDISLYMHYKRMKVIYRENPKCPLIKNEFLKARNDVTQDHNEGIVRVINSVVSKRDVLYILGDFGFGNVKSLKKWLHKLNGTKILVKGNHDRGSRVMLELGFSDVLENDYIYLNDGKGEKYKVYLSHYPFYPALWLRFIHWIYWRKNPDRRYLHKRIVDLGQILLHGHTHNSFIQDKSNPRQIHVGIDAWGKPVSELDLIEMIKALK